jgi:hypothetical protein
VSADITPSWRRPSTRSRASAAGALVAVLLCGVLVTQRTRAAFVADTANPASSWTAGTVDLRDDDAGSALFSVTGLLPGDSGERCIAVDYVGSLPSTVRLSAGGLTGTLGPYLDLVVEEASADAGAVGSFAGGCGAFTGTTVYSGTLAGLAATAFDFAHGVGSFAPAGGGQSTVYRFRYTLAAATPSAQQGTSAGAVLTWESRNS